MAFHSWNYGIIKSILYFNQLLIARSRKEKKIREEQIPNDTQRREVDTERYEQNSHTINDKSADVIYVNL